jgi:catechol-2,3-dioxygenase
MRIHELGHVVLYVTDLEKVSTFYRDTLGFKEILHEWPIAAFSAGRTHHEMLLIEVGPSTSSGQVAPEHPHRPKPGLYHIGFKVGDSTEELKGVYKELKAAGVNIIGTTDHTVTHSVYITDPDGNELELYADVSDAWRTDPSAISAPARPLDLKS